MKKLYFLLFTILMSTASFGQVIISELADPNNNAGARYVELYVVGPNAVDFTDWDLVRYTNLSTTLSTNTVNLTSLGTLQPDSYVLIAANGTTFQSTYGTAANISAGTGGPADSNGDDKIGLRDDMGTIVDIFGTPGANSSDTNDAMNFEDGRAERIATVNAPNTTWTATEWDTDNDQGFGAGAQDAPGGFDPGSWIGDASSCGVSLGTATFTCSTNTLGDNNDEVTINVPYTGSDMGITSVTSTVGVVSGDPAMTADGTLTITGQIAEGQAWDFTINGGNCDGTTISGTVPAAECDPLPSVCYDLSAGPEKFELVAVDTNSDGDVWTETSGEYNMNGFCGGGCSETSDAWLIFGPLNLSGMSDFSLSFTATEGFGPSDLNIQYTADYSSGCPSGATWTSAQVITDAGDYNVDLSMAAGSDVFIGIQYFNDDTSFSNWTLSNVSLGSFSGCPQLGTRPTSNCILCDISLQSEVINCNTNTEGANNDGVTIDIPYTGVDANITSVTSTTAMVMGSNPSVDTDGTITLANLSEGDAWDVTINGGGCDGTTLSGTVPTTNCDPQFLVINEIHADPASGLAGDANGDGVRDFSDDEFIELYNMDSNALDLSNYTIETGGTLRHTFAMNTSLPSGDYITIFGGGMINTRANTTIVASSGGLSLGNSGTTITIKDALGDTVTEYTYGSEGGNNQSIARNPDFTGPFVQHSTITSNPVAYSPGASNETSLSNNDFNDTKFSIFPNPTNTGDVNISSVNATPIAVTVFDILGKQVKNATISNNRLDVSNLKTGIYLLRLTQDGATSTKKLVIR